MNNPDHNTHPRVLLVATGSYAGMGPYVVSIVNSFRPDDNVRFFLAEREDGYYTRNIRPELKPLATIYHGKTPSKIDTLVELLLNPKVAYDRQIKQICRDEKIDIVHDIAASTNVGLARWFARNYKYIYTAHDLHPHQAKKAWHKMWRMNRLYARTFRIVDNSRWLFTNSLSQLDEMKRIYPDHESLYSNFPSLITEDMAGGNRQMDELKGLDKYILFFGRVEAYKGIPTLVDAWGRIADKRGHKLVVAGSGDLDRRPDPDIVYVNRYIHDPEIAEMYRRATAVVYPYTSATQSGVLSVAAYFGTPMITSDVPFFREELGDDYPLLFPAGDAAKLAEILEKILTGDNLAQMGELSKKIYESRYDAQNTREKLLQIYDRVHQAPAEPK